MNPAPVPGGTREDLRREVERCHAAYTGLASVSTRSRITQ